MPQTTTLSFHCANPYEQNSAYQALNTAHPNGIYSSGYTRRARYAEAGIEGIWDENWWPGRETYQAVEASNSEDQGKPNEYPACLVPGGGAQRTKMIPRGTFQRGRDEGQAVRRKELPHDARVPDEFMVRTKWQSERPGLMSGTPNTARSSSITPSITQAAYFPMLATPPSSIFTSPSATMPYGQSTSIACVIDQGGLRSFSDIGTSISRFERLTSVVTLKLRRFVELTAYV